MLSLAKIFNTITTSSMSFKSSIPLEIPIPAKFSRVGDASGSEGKAASRRHQTQLLLSRPSKRPSNPRPPRTGRSVSACLLGLVSHPFDVKARLFRRSLGKYTWIERSFEEQKPVDKASDKEDIVVPDSKLEPAIQVCTYLPS